MKKFNLYVLIRHNVNWNKEYCLLLIKEGFVSEEEAQLFLLDNNESRDNEYTILPVYTL